MESSVRILLRPYLSLLMLVPENEETQAAFLRELVVEANQSAVGLIDLLSDNIYYYNRERDELSLCVLNN